MTVKTTVRLWSDERYPVWSINNNFGEEVWVPLLVAARWERIQNEYDAMQKEMCNAWVAQHKEGA